MGLACNLKPVFVFPVTCNLKHVTYKYYQNELLYKTHT